MPGGVRKQKRSRALSGNGGPNGAGWSQAVAGRLIEVAGSYPNVEIASLTGTNYETVRRYMNTGKIPAQFLCAFCLAFQVDPHWVLFGGASKKLRKGGRAAVVKGAAVKDNASVAAQTVIEALRKSLADAERQLSAGRNGNQKPKRMGRPRSW